MKKIFSLVLIAIFFQSCNQTTQNQTDTTTVDSIIPSDTTNIHADTIASPESTEEYDAKIVSNHLLIPNAAYRILEANEIEVILEKGEWLELFKDKDGYHIGELSYSILHEDEEPCSGLPTQAVQSKNNAFMFSNLPHLHKGKVDTIAISNALISPSKPLEFVSNNKNYKLVASGLDFSLEHLTHENKRVYKIALYENDKFVRYLIKQYQYNDTHTELIFIGDLDKDGRPDFIFSSPRDYEEDRYLLILSSDEKIYEGIYTFDC